LYLHFYEFYGFFPSSKNGKFIISIIYHLSSVWYATKNRIDETGNSVIFWAFWEGEREVVIHVSDSGFCAHDIGTRTLLSDYFFFCVVFVLYFSDELFDDVLESDYASCFSVFVGDDCHLDMELLEVLEELLNFLIMRDKMRRTNEAAKIDFCIGTKGR